MNTRRAFITLLGGAAATWPLAARAQQRAIPVIGYLHLGAAEPYAAMMTAFREGLKQTGYTERENVLLEARWADGRPERLPPLAAELVRAGVNVLATGGGPLPARAAKQQTSTIPVLFIVSDPVEDGLVASLNHPEANLTGVSLFTEQLAPKRFELLREIVASPATVAVLFDPNLPRARDDIAGAAQTLGQRLDLLPARDDHEIDAAFVALSAKRVDALLIASSPLFTTRRHQIVALANHHRVPTIYPLREYVVAGGLLSYGTSIAEGYRQTGIYAGRVLNGAKAAELPVVQPTKFDLVINLRTAKWLQLEMPAKVLALADEVIE